MLEITKGTVQREACAQAFERIAQTLNEVGVCYIGYPVFSTLDGRMPIDALIVIKGKGVVVVTFVDGSSMPNDYRETMDDVYNKLKAKLQGCKALVRGRELAITINVLTYAPAVSRVTSSDEYPVCNDGNLAEYFANLRASVVNEELYRTTLSALQSITSLRSGARNRAIINPSSKGAILRKLENAISTLDHTQSKAVIETFAGVQRIRGLAGSGKTVVLALKAAYLHAQHPEWQICVTFHTRSLKEQFKRLITGFVIDATGFDPDWENLKIMQAWGSGIGEREGVYHKYCLSKNSTPMDYGMARNAYGMNNAFLGACNKALNDNKEIKVAPLFDVVLVDEAQDLPVDFLRICYELLTPTKRLVYAYDELQSLKQMSLPSPEEIFGYDNVGRPLVVLAHKSQDIMLKVCYRNSRPVLSAAHALGFGIYRTPDQTTGTGLIQMFEDRKLWEDVGYDVVSGRLEDGELVSLSRTGETSPEFLERDIPIDELIVFKKFDTYEEQAEWVASQIEKNLQQEELRATDIIVINPDPRTTRNNTGIVRAKLVERGINAHLVGVDTAPDVFFDTATSSITFSGVFRAKGNEAAMVYIINAQDCYADSSQLATVRNQLFTAMTRSKAWVRVLGVGDKMQKLCEEFSRIKANDFKLDFVYPTSELRRKLKIVNRDKSIANIKRIQSVESSVSGIIEAILSGEVQKDDLSLETLETLRKLIG